MNVKAKITELATALLPDESYFLVEVQVSESRIKSKVTILLDSDAGISIDECAVLSRELGRQLEELNLFENAYTLEVSSPGVDFPLTQTRQYQRNAGRKLRVQFLDGGEKIGTLQAVTDSTITLTTDGTKKEPSVDLVIPYSEIKKAQVLVSFK
ncbi:ribosome assembly cofactor RimP [Siphonobacter sp. BAB-5385]|uniref:ribosome maturation factor RimP n=1 Tax=unclassified Siphonobacter TaxID=2635712 RepID=UPI000B9EA755|nr:MULTISPECIES: ribosome maturation factor RimP [unclassified Siphonobacter]OZI08924.1 ribosome assembly cofactor RimP [Siphonobacter sp. BAB-5385]PMD96634.1 ribosome assembly cofactor RimP [Siphonobacter sp. BAB-5405]